MVTYKYSSSLPRQFRGRTSGRGSRGGLSTSPHHRTVHSNRYLHDPTSVEIRPLVMISGLLFFRSQAGDIDAAGLLESIQNLTLASNLRSFTLHIQTTIRDDKNY